MDKKRRKFLKDSSLLVSAALVPGMGLLSRNTCASQNVLDHGLGVLGDFTL